MELVLEEFKDWLQIKDPTEIIGHRQRTFHCPIACFIRAKTGSIAGVERYYHEIKPSGQLIENPTWALEFIQQIDKAEDTAVTADKALNILNTIEACHEY